MNLNIEKINPVYREIKLVTAPIFNESGTDDYDDQLLIGGNPTGIANMNTVRHQWAVRIYNKMWEQFWTPSKVDMTADRITKNQLTNDEYFSVKETLGFLIFMDSFQMRNLPNIFDPVTASMVTACGEVQVAFESMHTQAYQFMAEVLVPPTERDAIYNRWKESPALAKRIRTIAKIAQDYIDNPTLDNYYTILVANLILEGLYFYQGFNFFDQLAHRNRIVQSAKQIDYIRRDEYTHMGLFINMIKELGVDDELIIAMFKEAVEGEIEWCHHNYGNRILGITEKSSEQYVKYLANDRLARLGIDPIYEGIENPYQHLENASLSGGKRENFFESTVTSYIQADMLTGWGKL